MSSIIGNVTATLGSASKLGKPIEVATYSEMQAKLVTDNEGKVYKYTGTSGTYTNGDLYEVVQG